MKHEEDDLHKAALAWFDRQYPKVIRFHVPNGGKRHIREATKLKAFGTLAGTPDLFIVIPGQLQPAVEFKSKTGTLSPAQKEFRKRYEAQGGSYLVCRSLEEFQTAVRGWMK